MPSYLNQFILSVFFGLITSQSAVASLAAPLCEKILEVHSASITPNAFSDFTKDMPNATLSVSHRHDWREFADSYEVYSGSNFTVQSEPVDGLVLSTQLVTFDNSHPKNQNNKDNLSTAVTIRAEIPKEAAQLYLAQSSGFQDAHFVELDIVKIISNRLGAGAALRATRSQFPKAKIKVNMHSRVTSVGIGENGGTGHVSFDLTLEGNFKNIDEEISANLFFHKQLVMNTQREQQMRSRGLVSRLTNISWGFTSSALSTQDLTDSAKKSLERYKDRTDPSKYTQGSVLKTFEAQTPFGPVRLWIGKSKTRASGYYNGVHYI